MTTAAQTSSVNPDLVLKSKQCRMKAFNDRILILPDEEVKITSGGIIIPDIAKDSVTTIWGRVVGIGRGMLTHAGTIVPPQVAVGQRVVWNKYHGLYIEYDGRVYLSIREEELLGGE